MNRYKLSLLLLIAISILIMFPVLKWASTLDYDQLRGAIANAGVFAPLLFVLIYVVATVLLLPSTVLNLSGGILFGTLWGTTWCSVAAILAALITFGFTRSIGRNWIARRLNQDWQSVDTEIQEGGLFYLFSIRLLPIIPYGIVNGVSGLTSIRFRDYTLATVLGTVPGILPFVMLGNNGVTAVRTGDVLPIVLPICLIGLLVGGATWYRRSSAKRKLKP